MPKIIGSDTPSGLVGYGSFGVWGDSYSGPGVYGTSRDFSGVLGMTVSGSPAISGHNNANGAGMFGGSVDGRGVFGHSVSSVGLYGYSVNSTGVVGEAARYGAYAGEFLGNVRVQGKLSKSGGTFLIDHPLDPANKYLAHSFVESEDMKNIYDGVAVLDARGEATVQLPAWFDALNKDFRYQLTCIGGHAAVFIAREVNANSFQIAGGSPGLRVSWQLTGNRKDAWAKANPLVVEENKPPHERGSFLHPELFGEPAERSIRRANYAEPSVPRPAQPPHP